ncbi:MAG TPA: hypothetical protein VL860_02085 [Planctomycetota bacterium]|nr:hypothetical protein [Planctomycetota bacterium]
MSCLLVLVLGVACALPSALPGAERAPFPRGVIVGARAAGMGNAFTAVANDSTAIWWNPGGVAMINGPAGNYYPEIALSWGTKSVTRSNKITTEVDTLPQFASIIMPIPNGGDAENPKSWSLATGLSFHNFFEQDLGLDIVDRTDQFWRFSGLISFEQRLKESGWWSQYGIGLTLDYGIRKFDQSVPPPPPLTPYLNVKDQTKGFGASIGVLVSIYKEPGRIDWKAGITYHSSINASNETVDGFSGAKFPAVLMFGVSREYLFGGIDQLQALLLSGNVELDGWGQVIGESGFNSKSIGFGAEYRRQMHDSMQTQNTLLGTFFLAARAGLQYRFARTIDYPNFPTINEPGSVIPTIGGGVVWNKFQLDLALNLGRSDLGEFGGVVSADYTF